MVCAAAMGSGAYSFASDVATKQGSVAGSSAIPVNSRIVRVNGLTDRELPFVRDSETPNLLAANGGWSAIERPEHRLFNAWHGKDGAPNRREYCYVGGLLRFATIHGKDHAFDPKRWATLTNSIASLWPTVASRRADLEANDIWKGDGRLRMFSRNPNRTALIFVQLSLLAIGLLAFAKCRLLQTLGIVTSAACLAAVIATQSRGGLLALVTGGAAMAYFRMRGHFSWRTVRWLVAGMILVAACVYFGGYSKRISETVHGRDVSSASRLCMWREVPRMIAAAPLGWGLWNSGQAYNSWFEPPSRMHMTGDLFNDHLSRFVEGGYAFGGLHVFAWAFLFALGWRYARSGRSPVPLALLASYWVAACFNPMEYWRPSLYVPMLAGLGFLARELPSWRGIPARLKAPLLVAVAVTVPLLVVVAVVSALADKQDVPLRVSALGRRIVVGNGEPAVWVADDGFVLSGDYNGFPGKELRAFYAKCPQAESIGLVGRLEDLPGAIDKLVITGTLCRDFIAHPEMTKANRVILYSPPFSSDAVSPSLRKRYDIKLITGEHAAKLTGDFHARKKWVHIVPGAELYVPDWLDMVVRRNLNER